MKFNRCPLRLITEKSGRYIEAYRFFLKGYLPNDGGWKDQPAKFLDAVNVIEQELGKIETSRNKNNN